MLRPLAVIVGIMLLIGFATCTINRTVIHSARSTGNPMDHLGERTPCPRCNPPGSQKILPGSMAEAGRGYDYRCPRCNHRFQARWNDAERRIEIDW